MKKILLFTLLVFAISTTAQTTFVYNADSHELTQTKDEITVTIAQGSGSIAPVWKASFNEEILPSDMRLYLGNTITVSSSQPLTDIKMVFAKSCASNKDYTGLAADNGTLASGGDAENYSDWKIDSWTGNATKVVFTLTGTGQRRIYSLVVNGEALMPVNPVDKPLPTEADLLPTYVYPEPTNVAVPDTTIIKKEYAFIHNNILVHCELGSIVKAEEGDPDDEEDFGHPAYFNCNAEHSITFTASKPIKGIAIDGYVRKAFNATCDNGSITFLTNPDYEMEGWPALVIQDVNATSTTIYCPKQFRCYALHVYFVNNPDAIDMPTAIDNIDAKQNNSISPLQPTKILQNGQLFILRNNQTFSAQGQLLR